MRVWTLSGLLASVACVGPAQHVEHVAAPVPARPSPGLAEPAREPAPALAPVVDAQKVGAALCAEIEGCEGFAAHGAGSGPNGEGLVVVEVRHANDGDPSCQRSAWWSVVSAPGKERATQLLLTLCEREDTGESEVIVGSNRFRHEHREIGGHAVRSGHFMEVQLAPLRWLSWDEWAAGLMGEGWHGDERNWQEFRFAATRSLAVCDAHGQPTFTEGVEDEESYTGLAVPQVKVPDSFDWKRHALTRCGLQVDGSEDHGYVAHGKLDGPRDASFRALLVDDQTLIVEVQDDKLVAGASSWLYDDHLELWLGDEPSGSPSCDDGSHPPKQWAVRLADGEVFAAHGKPREPLRAERHERRSSAGEVTVVVKIALPRRYEHMTVVYSDSDGGVQQSALLATSALRAGKVRVGGPTLRLRPEEFICELDGDALRVRDLRTYEPDVALAAEGWSEEP
jgi:hypothetical protein